MSQWCRSDAFAAIHETMKALHDAEAISGRTMRRFDDTCLAPALQREDALNDGAIHEAGRGSAGDQ